MSQCIITGCRLVIPAENKSLWGDLHECGPQTFVFNGVTNPLNRQANWDFQTMIVPTAYNVNDKWVIVDGDYFEKRGIVTVPADNCTFNDAAKQHLQIE